MIRVGILFFVLYSIFYFILIQIISLHGGVGLICANLFNMVLRIIWSFSFIKDYMSKRKLFLDKEKIFPQLQVVVIMILDLLILLLMFQATSHKYLRLAIGTLLGLLSCLSILIFDKNILLDLMKIKEKKME
jgi:hypothetical protein